MARRTVSSPYLDAVTRARSELIMARATLESKLRQELEEKLLNMETQLDIAVRYAFDNGHTKSQILSAMGTKYYGIINESLARTEGVVEVKGVSPLDSVYSFDFDSGEFTAIYDKHGPEQISGNAIFDFRILSDGTKWFMSKTSLWNEDFTVRNDVVAALDNRQNGYYYEEALEWVQRVIDQK